MYANIKKIKKPIQKQDFFLPSGESPYSRKFPIFRNACGLWRFQSLNIKRANELAQDNFLIICPRTEIKVELRKSFRNGGKVSSKTWHLASIMDRDVYNPIKREAFWQKIDGKLKTFELLQEEETKIRAKIEAEIPRTNVWISKQ